MANILQKWNSATQTWIDLSELARKINLDLHLDIFEGREIIYNGQTLIINDDFAIENGDYIRYGTDGAPNNYNNVLEDVDSEMSSASLHHWVAGLNSPTFDVNTTVAGKMYFDAAVGTGEEIDLDLPNQLTAGKTYRIKVKVRLNTSGGTNAIRFGIGVGATSGYYFEVVPTGTEAEYEGTFTTVSGYRDFRIYALADSSGAFEIDDLRVYIESDPILFSGYVANLTHKLKIGKYEFDIENEIAELKNRDIPRVLTGDNLRQRLSYVMPEDYCFVVMDSIAELMLNLSPSGFDSFTYPGDEVTGTDSNIYTCRETHIATADDKPVTGANWTDYWSLAGSSGGTWELGKEYAVMRLNDLLYDTLLIANACVIPAGTYILFCVVINHELRFYGKSAGASPAIVGNQYINECDEGLSREIVFFPEGNTANEDLRGTGALTTGSAAWREWLMKVHKLKTTYEAQLMDKIGCARPGGGDPIAGLVTSIEKSGSMFNYELTNLELVT